jgi:ribose transport system ATP-binding protein
VTGAQAAPAIAVEAVRKAYGSTVALDGASLAISSGSVHALLGENGAGKSTLVKLLSGLIRPDQGRIRVFDQQAELRTPSAAHRLGVQTAFQELTLLPDRRGECAAAVPTRRTARPVAGASG